MTTALHALLWGAMALAQDAPAEPPSKSVLDYINEGGVVSYVLVFASFIAVGLMVRNLILIRRTTIVPPDAVARLDQLLRARDLEGAAAYCAARENDSFLTRVVGSGLARVAGSTLGFIELRPAMEEAAAREVERLYRLVDGLGIIAAIGPMLGLLGTVFGMIGAFATISVLEGVARSTQLAGYMSIALITTAEGLIIAIPCTIVFTLFRRRIDTLTDQAAQAADTLTSHLGQGGAGDGPRATSPRAARPTPRPESPAGSRA